MHKLIPLAIVATAAVAGGCGGNSDKTLTKSQVIARGGVICKTAEKRVEKLPQLTLEHPFAKGTPATTRRAARTFLTGYADALEYSRKGLGALAAPAQDRQLLDGYLADLRRIVAQFRVAAKAPDARVEAAAQDAFAMFEKASSQTKRYGFPRGVCGSGAS